MNIFGTCLVVASLTLVGCKDLLEHGDAAAPGTPDGVRTATGDDFIELFWNANSEEDLSGYNIFVSSSYNGRYELIGSTTAAYFMDNGARNGNTYYYAVTALDYDGNESDLSRDVAYDVPRPEGYDVTIDNYHLSVLSSGYDFSTYSIVRYDDQYADMYYENYNGTYYMNVRTDTDIQDVGHTNSLLEINVAPSGGWSTTHDARLYVGHTYVVWTYDNHYAKFRVTNLSPGRVVFDWAYQLQVSNPMLRPVAAGGDRQKALK